MWNGTVTGNESSIALRQLAHVFRNMDAGNSRMRLSNGVSRREDMLIFTSIHDLDMEIEVFPFRLLTGYMSTMLMFECDVFLPHLAAAIEELLNLEVADIEIVMNVNDNHITLTKIVNYVPVIRTVELFASMPVQRHLMETPIPTSVVRSARVTELHGYMWLNEPVSARVRFTQVYEYGQFQNLCEVALERDQGDGVLDDVATVRVPLDTRGHDFEDRFFYLHIGKFRRIYEDYLPETKPELYLGYRVLIAELYNNLFSVVARVHYTISPSVYDESSSSSSSSSGSSGDEDLAEMYQ